MPAFQLDPTKYRHQFLHAAIDTAVTVEEQLTGGKIPGDALDRALAFGLARMHRESLENGQHRVISGIFSSHTLSVTEVSIMR